MTGVSTMAETVQDTAEKVAELDEETVFTTEEAGDLVAGLFDLAADRLGDHWRLDDHEKQVLGKPLAKVLNKHWDSVGRYAEEAALAIAAASLLGGKIREHQTESL